MLRSRSRVLAASALVVGSLGLTAGSASADHRDSGRAAFLGCGSVITRGTTLGADVGPCSGDGLIITASNIRVNLNGYRVFAATSPVVGAIPARTANGDGDNAGIRLANVVGVTVTNGTVERFDSGVVIGGGAANTVTRVTVQDNVNDFRSPPCEAGDGIAILDSSANRIENNTALRNGPFGGISVVGNSDGNRIRANVATDNNIRGIQCGNAQQDEGIRIEGPGADGNKVQRNLVENNLLAGIGLHGYVCDAAGAGGIDPPNRGTAVEGNVARGTTAGAGINFLQQGPAGIVCPAFGSLVDSNVSTGNSGDGIFVATNSHDNVINRNTVNGNDASGLFLNDTSFRNLFTNVGPTVVDLVTPDRAPFVEGTDFVVMSGSGSGNVMTGRLRPIDIAFTLDGTGMLNTRPVDSSTSGCEQADYDAAGFVAGDVALIQRGTCTFAAKVNLAVANGASAIVMFNEGQTGRTAFTFGGVAPAMIPIIAATFGTGVALTAAATPGPATIQVTTNTTNVQVIAAPAPFDNTLRDNRGFDNGDEDGYDGNFDPPCDNNVWEGNIFGTVNQACVGGQVGVGGDRRQPRADETVQDVGREAASAV